MITEVILDEAPEDPVTLIRIQRVINNNEVLEYVVDCVQDSRGTEDVLWSHRVFPYGEQ